MPDQPNPTTIYVCRTCRHPGHDDAMPRPGARMLEALAAATRDEPSVAVRGVKCLSACKRACAVAVAGGDKFTYVVADTDPDAHAADLVAFAKAHGASADGITPWRERPEIVRRSVLARVPALGQTSELID